MDKRTAFNLAKKFKQEKLHLSNRFVRYTDLPASGYNSASTWYLVPAGPHGGMKKSKYIASANNGIIIINARAGDVIMRQDIINGWSLYSSTVVLPHDESNAYANANWSSEFSIEEQIESVEWAITHLGMEEDDPFYLDHVLKQLEEAQEFQSIYNDWQEAGCPQ